MAGGSQIIISDQGITISTNGKILYQAGQHKFEGGAKSISVIPMLPKSICLDCMKNAADNGSVFIKK